MLRLAAASTIAPAQTYPNKIVRLVSPYAAGGGNDLTARILSRKLGEALGQQFIAPDQRQA